MIKRKIHQVFLNELGINFLHIVNIQIFYCIIEIKIVSKKGLLSTLFGVLAA